VSLLVRPDGVIVWAAPGSEPAREAWLRLDAAIARWMIGG
jgi:hypothetical protein